MRSRRPTAPGLEIEDLAGRMRRALAVPGPEDDRIGHHQTYTGNLDPTKRTLAVCSSPKTGIASLVHILRWRACGR